MQRSRVLALNQIFFVSVLTFTPAPRGKVKIERNSSLEMSYRSGHVQNSTIVAATMFFTEKGRGNTTNGCLQPRQLN